MNDKTIKTCVFHFVSGDYIIEEVDQKQIVDALEFNQGTYVMTESRNRIILSNVTYIETLGD